MIEDLEDDINQLDQAVDGLAQSLGSAVDLSAQFSNELGAVKTSFGAAIADVSGLERSLSTRLRGAFRDVIVDGDSLSDAMGRLGTSLANSAFNAALRPVTDHVGGLISNGVGNLIGGLLPFANGGTFAQGRVQPFASGGVVSQPTRFPMRGGTGLMGEAGPEAIMPLARGPDGRLGVQASTGGSTNVTINIQTPDVEGFRRSQSQIAAQMGRVLGRARRNQ